MAVHRLLVALAALTLLAAQGAPLSAQEEDRSSWQILPHGEFGWLIPMRNVGKNATILGSGDQEGVLQVVADVDPGLAFGGGITVQPPDSDLRIRASVRTTSGVTADGILALCQSDVFNVPDICTVQQTDASLVEGTVDLIFLSVHRDRRISPTVFVGVGLRKWSFDSETEQCDGLETGDPRNICVAIREIWEDPAVDPALSFGAGLRGLMQPLEAFVQFRTVASQYSGGSERADGETLIDVVLSGGLSLRLR